MFELIMLRFWVLFALIVLSRQVCDSSLCLCANDSCQSCLNTWSFLSANNCMPCPYQCASCTPTNCTACIASFLLSNSSCLPCPANCASCSTNACLSCQVTPTITSPATASPTPPASPAAPMLSLATTEWYSPVPAVTGRTATAAHPAASFACSAVQPLTA